MCLTPCGCHGIFHADGRHLDQRLLRQVGQVDVHYLIAPGSADDIIWPTVNQKLQVVGTVLDGHLAGTAVGESCAGP
jgi:hypothetical protein